jgi:F0F1-type ATP synthase assembly protein I
MADETIARPDAPAISSGTGTQVFLGLLWLGTSMWVAHATINGTDDDISGTLGSAAAALPGVVAATLVTTASIASAASSRFPGAGRRLLVGLATGVLFGAAAAAGIRFGYGSASSITVLAITVGVASVLGGAAAALPNSVLEACLWATTWVFFAGVIFGVLQPQLTRLLGGGPTADLAAQTTADTRFTYAQSVLTGLIAGVYASRSLRGEQYARAWYLVAGALPGLLLVAAEGLTRAGGESLVNLVQGFAPDETVLLALSDVARLRHGLIVLAVGGAVATLAARRTGSSSDSPAS